jgi:tetratricopeptide (TPR) repeat protein
VLALAQEHGDRAQIARTQQRLGILLFDRGDLDRALKLQYEAAGELGHLGHGGEAALALVSAANVHRQQGNEVRALWTLERALAVARQVGDGKAEAQALANLGSLRRHLGDVEEGLRLQEQAVAIWEKGGDRRSLVTGLLGLTRAHVSLRQAERAIPYVNRALLLAKELRNEGLIARAEAAHAEVLIAVGRLDVALTIAESAVRRVDEQGDLRNIAAAWQTLGDVRHARMEPALALPALHRAAQAARRLRSPGALVVALAGEALALRALNDPAGTLAVARAVAAELEGLSRGHDEESAASVRARGMGALEQGALAAQMLGDGDAAVFFLESGRAGALLEALGTGAALRAEDLTEGLRKVEAEARAGEAEALARFTRALEERAADLDARGADLDAARERRREAARRIQRWAKARGGGAAPAVASADEIRRALAPGDVLVLYGWFGSHVMAAVVRPGGVRVVTVGSRTPTEQAIDAVSPATHDVVSPEAIAAARAAVLGALELTSGDRRILVSPDGPLDRAPFALLEEEREVVLVPSGSVLGLLRARAETRGTGVLALGDPEYGKDAGGSLRSGLGLPRLPATADEAKAVGDVVLLGAEATEPGLRAALATRARWRAVHLACHGLIDSDRPLLSCLALAPSADDDGLLTGHEILRLNVPADLVVLSGCDTAKGKAFWGEGVLGLSRAFLLAGAPRVRGSLWKVGDEATRLFMETLYAGWKQGEPLGAALSRARARLRADPRWSHPRHWAAFVLWGLPE